jgi:hydrogenase-4 membrane subunit HyfE
LANGGRAVSPLLVALLGILLLPLFVASWRTSIFGLGCQGLLMASIAHRLEPDPRAAQDFVLLADLAIVRGLIVPFALYGILRARNTPARNDVIPPNLLSWTVALSLVLASFSFAEVLVPEAGEQRTLVAVATAGMLLGFLVLATQSDPLSQMIGALRIENAIALLELGGKKAEPPLGLQLALLAVFVTTLAYFRFYLSVLGSAEPSASADVSGRENEGPTL